MELMKNLLVMALAAGVVACGGGSSGSSNSSDDNGDKTGGSDTGTNPDTSGGSSAIPKTINRDNYLDFADTVWMHVSGLFFTVAPTSTFLSSENSTNECSNGGTVIVTYQDIQESDSVITDGVRFSTYNNCDEGAGPRVGPVRHEISRFEDAEADYKGLAIKDDATLVNWLLDLSHVTDEGIYLEQANYYYLRYDDWYGINPGYIINELQGTEYSQYLSSPDFSDPELRKYTSDFIGSEQELAIRNKECMQQGLYNFIECSVVKHEFTADDGSLAESTMAMGEFEPLFGAGKTGLFEADYITTKPLIVKEIDGEDVLVSGELVLTYNTGQVIKVEVREGVPVSDTNNTPLAVSLDEDGDGVYDVQSNVYDGLVWINPEVIGLSSD